MIAMRLARNCGYLTVGLQRLFDTGGRVSSCLAPRNPRSRWRTSATIFPRGKTETSSRVFRHFAFLEISNPQAESARVFTEAGHRGVSLIRVISASPGASIAFSCACSEVGWDLCA